MTRNPEPLRRIRFWLALFIAGLVLSGVTAFPLAWELDLLRRIVAEPPSSLPALSPALVAWIERVNAGLQETYRLYPFMAYGTDWLAFAHLVIAVAFAGPWRDPVRNVWVIEWAMIACALVIPLTLICGPLRGIPLFWRAIDCSFGVFGVLPLYLCLREIRRLERIESRATAVSRSSAG